jgi:hypothetical protein
MGVLPAESWGNMMVVSNSIRRKLLNNGLLQAPMAMQAALHWALNQHDGTA